MFKRKLSYIKAASSSKRFAANFRAQLYGGRMTASNGQIAIQQISKSKTYAVIRRIEFYTADSAIQPSNKQGQTVYQR